MSVLASATVGGKGFGVVLKGEWLIDVWTIIIHSLMLSLRDFGYWTNLPTSCSARVMIIPQDAVVQSREGREIVLR